MPEVTFNPDTGSGEFVQRGGAQAESSHQERADLRQSIAFRNTAENLTERSHQKAGTDPTQVASGNIDIELKLQETQRELYQMHNGAIPHNALRALQLEALQNTLAASLVGGEAPAVDAPVNPENEWTKDTLKTDLEEGLASDPKTQATIAWSAETFSDETNGLFNEILDHSANAETTQQFVGALNTIKENPASFSTEVGSELTPATVQQIEQEYGAELAKDITTLSAAVANGLCTKQEAILQAVRNPKLAGAMLNLAQNPDIDFRLSL